MVFREYKDFHSGPFPTGWFKQASEICPSAVTLGMIMWGLAYRKMLFGRLNPRRVSRPFKVTDHLAKGWSVCSKTRIHILREMEKREMIHLKIKRGASPEVRIIDNEIQNWKA